MISEFIKNYQFNDVSNPYIYNLIDECFEELSDWFCHDATYGWDHPDYWDLNLLDEFEQNISIEPDEFLEIFPDCIEGILYVDGYYIPLILALRLLIEVHTDDQPELSRVIIATRLIDCYNQIPLFNNIDLLLKHIEHLKYSRVNITTQNKKNQAYDSRPEMVIAKDLLRSLVNPLLDDVNQVDKRIRDTVKKEFMESINSNSYLNNEDIHNSTITRWFDELITEYSDNKQQEQRLNNAVKLKEFQKFNDDYEKSLRERHKKPEQPITAENLLSRKW